MAQSRTERLIAWSIALFSVAAVWQTDMPQYIASLVFSMGIERNSPLYQVLVSGGISAVFVGVSWLAVHLQDDLIWRWWRPLGCKRGWWIYGLIAERDEGPVLIVGVFYLLHTPYGARITEGHAFYNEGNGKITPRGDWDSDVAWVNFSRIRHLFTMRSVNPVLESIPGLYDGYMSLTNMSVHSIGGIESWRGFFQDLGDRREVAGNVYAERLSPLRVHHAGEAIRVMRQCAQALNDRCTYVA